MQMMTADSETVLDTSLDLNSVINILLPLELYEHAPFLSEQSFDRLIMLLESHRSSITKTFIFAICDILCYDASFLPEKILPAVLKRLRTWRTLSLEDRHLDIARLARDLAGLVNTPLVVHDDFETTFPRPLRIRWISQDSDIDTDASTAPDSEPVMLYEFVEPDLHVQLEACDQASQRKGCQDVHHHEYVQFRSGCCACRQPRTQPWDLNILPLPASPVEISKQIFILPRDGHSQASGTSQYSPTPQTKQEFLPQTVVEVDASTTHIPSVPFQKTTRVKAISTPTARARATPATKSCKDTRTFPPNPVIIRSTAAKSKPADENKAPSIASTPSTNRNLERTKRVASTSSSYSSVVLPVPKLLDSLPALPASRPSSVYVHRTNRKPKAKVPSLSHSSFSHNIASASTSSATPSITNKIRSNTSFILSSSSTVAKSQTKPVRRPPAVTPPVRSSSTSTSAQPPRPMDTNKPVALPTTTRVLRSRKIVTMEPPRNPRR